MTFNVPITSINIGNNFQSKIDALRYAGLTYVMKRAETDGLIGTPINNRFSYQLNQYWQEFIVICKYAGMMLDANLEVTTNQGQVQLSWTPYQGNTYFDKCPICNDLVDDIQNHCTLRNDPEHTALLVHNS
jgi:hypothetical protein